MSKSHFLYRHFGANGELLYIGVTNNVQRRVKDHIKKSDWFCVVRNITMELFESREDALDAEKEAIIKENPKYNILHSRHNRRVDLSPDYGEEALERIRIFLLDTGPLTKTAFAKECKILDLGEKKVRKLIKRGAGRFWRVESIGQKNAQMLTAIHIGSSG